MKTIRTLGACLLAIGAPLAPPAALGEPATTAATLLSGTALRSYLRDAGQHRPDALGTYGDHHPPAHRDARPVAGGPSPAQPGLEGAALRAYLTDPAQHVLDELSAYGGDQRFEPAEPARLAAR